MSPLKKHQTYGGCFKSRFCLDTETESDDDLVGGAKKDNYSSDEEDDIDLDITNIRIKGNKSIFQKKRKI